jgi:hypothetical protein
MHGDIAHVAINADASMRFYAALTESPGSASLLFFADPGGNVAGAIRYA